MKSAKIRQAFLNYFAEQGHDIVASSSLVPGNDPTLRGKLLLFILLFQSSRRIFLARENLERIFQTGMVACAKKLSLTPDKDKLKAG